MTDALGADAGGRPAPHRRWSRRRSRRGLTCPPARPGPSSRSSAPRPTPASTSSCRGRPAGRTPSTSSPERAEGPSSARAGWRPSSSRATPSWRPSSSPAGDRAVPFKCTAGLHHAVRYTDPTTGFRHHGVLNILVATARAVPAGRSRRPWPSSGPSALAAEAAAIDPPPRRPPHAPSSPATAPAASTSRWPISSGSACCRGPERRDRPWPVRPLRPSTAACGCSSCWRQPTGADRDRPGRGARCRPAGRLPPAGHPRGPRPRRGRRRRPLPRSASAWSRLGGRLLPALRADGRAAPARSSPTRSERPPTSRWPTATTAWPWSWSSRRPPRTTSPTAPAPAIRLDRGGGREGHPRRSSTAGTAAALVRDERRAPGGSGRVGRAPRATADRGQRRRRGARPHRRSSRIGPAVVSAAAALRADLTGRACGHRWEGVGARRPTAPPTMPGGGDLMSRRTVGVVLAAIGAVGIAGSFVWRRGRRAAAGEVPDRPGRDPGVRRHGVDLPGPDELHAARPADGGAAHGQPAPRGPRRRELADLVVSARRSPSSAEGQFSGRDRFPVRHGPRRRSRTSTTLGPGRSPPTTSSTAARPSVSPSRSTRRPSRPSSTRTRWPPPTWPQPAGEGEVGRPRTSSSSRPTRATPLPISPAYFEVLNGLTPLPSELTLDQLKPILLSVGLDVDTLLPALLPNLKPRGHRDARRPGRPADRAGVPYTFSGVGLGGAVHRQHRRGARRRRDALRLAGSRGARHAADGARPLPERRGRRPGRRRRREAGRRADPRLHQRVLADGGVRGRHRQARSRTRSS